MKQAFERPDTDRVLGGLKDFQRDTVEYVFKRMYTDSDYSRRFLIADEVGLGKTMIARGLIAKALDHLWDKVKRLDVVYICSNGDIARQNVNKLRIGGTNEFAMSSRITLLPTRLTNLKKNKVNFISFTPSTSFNLRSATGTYEERVLLYHLLDAEWSIGRDAASLNLLRAGSELRNFKWYVDAARDFEMDSSIRKSFLKELGRKDRAADANGFISIRQWYDRLAETFAETRDTYPEAATYERAQFIGELREMLAATCLTALEPDLIILDEFQRFKHLLGGDDQAGKLARDLFDYTDETSEARVLMLSATPYKMYTQSNEAEGDDHYVDFLRTIQFLQKSEQQTAEFTRLVGAYRNEVLRIREGSLDRLKQIKVQLEGMMRKVMVRTERLAATENRDGMLTEVQRTDVRLHAHDVRTYAAVQRVGRAVGSGDTIEFWKSAPYLFNFMDDYQLKRKLEDAAANASLRRAVVDALTAHDSLLFPWAEYERYRAIDPGNGRLRALFADTVDRGAWRLLWVPPSLPYYRLEGAFAQPGVEGFTKRLIFSSWKVVPKAIATLISYEAERLMVGSYESDPENSTEARKERSPLLTFTRSSGRLNGMPVLGILYPCDVLATDCDPLSIGRELRNAGVADPTLDELAAEIRPRIERLLAELPEGESGGNEDERWYWAAPILFDGIRSAETTTAWFGLSDLSAKWAAREDEGEDRSAWSDHVQEARAMLRDASQLGRRPEDLADVLTVMALAAPGTVALRSLRRLVTPQSQAEELDVRTGAARIAWGMRNLFNLPEALTMIRGLYATQSAPRPYWQLVLRYAAEGCLQSALDEYLHYTREAQGLFDVSIDETVRGLSDTTLSALTLRTAPIYVDDVQCEREHGAFAIQKRSMRTHFAIRFGDDKVEDEKQGDRKKQVRDAFNSPFWPFVIASTSVGQEGLDFHPYCHAVVHWNLPSNPVDLEQREGRVHRYKGHAVRKNLALVHGAELLRSGNGHADPWASLFEIGANRRASGASDLVPFWIYPVEGGAAIERHVLALPLSHDRERAESLRRALTIYRMVFGQNRQEDLLAYLDRELTEEEKREVGEALRVELGPCV